MDRNMNVQKLVIVNPGGIMTDSRKRSLDKTGCPVFKGSHASKSWHTKLDYAVPSDIHMFWEGGGSSSSHKEDGNVVSTLSVVLVGNANPPDLSQYADTVKKIVFFGHICRMKTAFQMVTQLKACEVVEFLLGSKEQLDLYYFDDSNLSMREDNELLMDGGVNSLVHSVTVRTSVSQNVSSEKASMKEIVLKQIETVLRVGPILWPSVKKMVVDLPGDGVYLDLVKQFLPMWSGIHQFYGVELKSSKICLGKKTADRMRRVSGFDSCHSGMDNSRVRLDDNAVKNCDSDSEGIHKDRLGIETNPQQLPTPSVSRDEIQILRSDNSNITDDLSVQNPTNQTAAFTPVSIQLDTVEMGRYQYQDVNVKPSLEVLKSRVSRVQEDLLEHESPIPDPNWESSRSPVYCNPSRPTGSAVTKRKDAEIPVSQQLTETRDGQTASRQSTLSPVSSAYSSLQSVSSPSEEGEIANSQKNVDAPLTPPSTSTDHNPRVYTDELAQQFLRRSEMTPETTTGAISPDSSTERGHETDNPTPGQSGLRKQRDMNSTPSYWKKSSSEERDLLDKHSSTSGSSGQNVRSPQPERQKYRSAPPKNKDMDANCIVIMGIPEEYTAYQLSDIMKRISPNWIGQVKNQRIGLGLRGPRPLKVILRNQEEVEEAIENAVRYRVYINDSLYLRVGKYRPELDGKNIPKKFQRRLVKPRYRPRESDYYHENDDFHQRDSQRQSRSRSRSSSRSWRNSRSRSRSIPRSSRSNNIY